MSASATASGRVRGRMEAKGPGFVRSVASWTVAIGVVCLSTSAYFASAASDNSFDPGCPIPYASIAQEQAIDDACNQFGESASYQPSDDAQRLSNAAKNNLCATGPVVPLAMTDFRALMTAVKNANIPYGRGRALPNRGVLRGLITRKVDGANVSVGEGTLVVFRGYVADAAYGRPESVNCQRKGVKNYDIHIGLVAKRSDSRCKGIVAEMIPHYRPKAWTPGAIKKIKRPVRVTGRLFFDVPHVPCNPDGTIEDGNPRRASLWEIHPIYFFEVCEHTSLAACRVSRDEDWTLLGAQE